MLKKPEHIGVIPDGNRRWAKLHGLNKEDGYEYGLKAGLKLLEAAARYGVKELTFYGFTADNCKRPKEQVAAFSSACVKAAELIKDKDVSLTVIGNTGSDRFPRELKRYSERGERAREDILRVNLLVNYSWEWDMKNGFASRGIPRIDLVLRWGGMSRLSGFLPLQTVYSDICVIPELWPDFDKTQFERALDWYSRQDVTLGG